MKDVISVAAIILLTFVAASAQKSNDAISKQIKLLKAENAITLSYNAAADTTKILIRAENFDGKQTAKAGIQAINFGMALIYPGTALVSAPDTFDYAFWVMTKKPKFASAHRWIVTLSKETLDLGDARYASKPRENMEYLNFKISRNDLTKIAAETNVRFKLGNAEFTFKSSQLTIFKNVLAVAENK
jgi:cytochrome c biogenesis factor